MLGLKESRLPPAITCVLRVAGLSSGFQGFGFQCRVQNFMGPCLWLRICKIWLRLAVYVLGFMIKLQSAGLQLRVEDYGLVVWGSEAGV